MLQTMDLCNSKHSHFQFPRPHFAAFRITIFLLLIYSTNSISFDISCFKNYTDILYQGDAQATDHAIQLTGGSQVHKHVSGRALYRKPMHLWDKATGRLTDFSTRFSFAINSGNEYLPGDGLSFFLLPNGSSIPPNSSSGFLGLVNGGDPINTTKYQFVAVEFDNYIDSWDPNVEHVGININSIWSVKYVKWHCSAKKIFSVVVHYNADRKVLCVMLIDQADYTALTGNSTLCEVIDLRDHLPEWVNIGFSASTRELPQINSIFSWQFNSSLEDTGNSHKKKKKSKWLLQSAIGAFAVIGLIIGFILLWLMPCRKQDSGGRQNDDVIVDSSIDDELARASGPKRFSYRELEQATNYFAEQGKLGQGGFGGVFRGFLIDLSQNVAVKRFSKGSKQGRKEYKSEVKIISRLRHRNLVQLVGWCHERGEFLLVYEFMPNGSLDAHLFWGKSMLLWEVRYKIALGLASALLYLHEEWEQCVVHRDVKSSNVMLDTNFNAKLGDFGLARLIDHELGPKTTGPAGTMGYIAPEYISTGKASKESDIYSFGIVALEIACGRRAIEPDIEDSKVTLVAWVWELYGNDNLLDAVDRKLCGNFNVEQMERLLIVGLWCAHPDHNLRPSIRQAVQVLHFEAGAPNLPLKMPVAMYHVPNSSTSSSSEPLMTFTSFKFGR